MKSSYAGPLHWPASAQANKSVISVHSERRVGSKSTAHFAFFEPVPKLHVEIMVLRTFCWLVFELFKIPLRHFSSANLGARNTLVIWKLDRFDQVRPGTTWYDHNNNNNNSNDPPTHPAT